MVASLDFPLAGIVDQSPAYLRSIRLLSAITASQCRFKLVKAEAAAAAITQIDPLTGVATDIGLLTGGTAWAGLVFGPATNAA